MKGFFLSVLFLSCVNGESLNGFGIRRTLKQKFKSPDVAETRTFEAPDIVSRTFEAPDVVVSARTRSDVIADVPVLSEWDEEYSDLNQRLIIIGGRGKLSRTESFNEGSEVASLFHESCRKCMVSGNMECIGRMCSLMTMLVPEDSGNVQHASFVTGVSLHGDLLCSLCKNADNAECVAKFCEDPERDKHVENSGVECMQGFCRWQKETVARRTGFNAYYDAWWQPNSLVHMVDQFTRHLASAYQDFYVATSSAFDILG